MLAAAALAAMALATNDPTAFSHDPLATPTRTAAVAHCMEPEPPKSVFNGCVRTFMRDGPARRALGPAYDWARPIIEGAGWSVRGADADRVALSRYSEGTPAIPAASKDEKPTPAMPRAWLRVERRVASETAPYLSAVWLYEFDCVHQAMHPLQTTLYAANNQQGAATILPADKPKDEYANPGTVADVLMRDTCPPTQTASANQPLDHPDAR